RSAGRPVFVAGSVAPAVSPSLRHRVPAPQRVDAIREQVDALLEGGVDIIAFETFGHLHELVEAVTAVADLGVPIVAQATFTMDARTPGGQTPQEVATALSELPVAVIGTNCTLGPQGLLTIVNAMRQATNLPISAQPNAGLPRRVGVRQFEYQIDGGYVAGYARRYIMAGASLVGGCCGTTPVHIGTMVEELADLREQPVASEPDQSRIWVVELAGGDHSGDADHGAEGDLAEQLAEGRFVVAADISPPPGGVADDVLAEASELRDRGIGMFFVAPRRWAPGHVDPTNLALHLAQQLGVPTIATATTWDKTIMTLQADLLGAHALGVRSVVCETGNPPLRGDYPNVDGIWEVDSVGLIELLSGLNTGRDHDGLALASKTTFHIGARFNPGASDVDAELRRTEAKLAAGAQFLVSRPVHELERFRYLVEGLGLAGRAGPARVPVLLAVSPLRSFAQAEYLAHEVPDVIIPEATLETMRKAGEDGLRAGRQLSVELLGQARGLARGVVLGVTGMRGETVDELLRAI
ncbi:MAG: homocysteine S-methyltransferase family protein, partial [Micromonosporaceae bacterium]|nr:homocysteine S-methyltransferase family protein [Micromonosporaceae bacterium]